MSTGLNLALLAQLEVLGATGTVNLTDPVTTGLTSTYYEGASGWTIAAKSGADALGDADGAGGSLDHLGAILMIVHGRGIVVRIGQDATVERGDGHAYEWWLRL